jgi:hypothetical protein
MENIITEALYPISFRQKDAAALGSKLKARNNVVLIGMKRVGISNFLRFFLNHNQTAKAYIADGNQHLFVSVDLNDMVEREVFPFWILTLKRILDSVENSSLKELTKKNIEKLFLDSMQSKDTFLTIENIKKSLIKITDEGFLPSIFFIRFDRLREIITPELFGNLLGLKEALNQKVSFVFTSYRGLTDIAPDVFIKSSVSLFAQNIYIKPADEKDAKMIFETYESKHKFSLSDSLRDYLFEIAGGYVQYLFLALISFYELDIKPDSKEKVFDFLVKDERITLQSEELWESLNAIEQEILLKIEKNQKINPEERKAGSYLWNSGFIVEEEGKNKLFSPLFGFYLKERQASGKTTVNIDLSKKENLLFGYLKNNIGNICEREEIIQAVWAEVEEFGVSDWAIDRLVARLRVKLKSQNSKFEIQTIKTRGYKMIEV